MTLDQQTIEEILRSFMNVANKRTALIDHNQYTAILSQAGVDFSGAETERIMRRLFKGSRNRPRKINYENVLQSVEEIENCREHVNETRSIALAACKAYDFHGNGLIADCDLLIALWDINIQIDCGTVDRAEEEELASSNRMIRYKEFIEDQVLPLIEYL